MKNTRSFIACSALALAWLLTIQTAHATGVTAGTLIENTASASYTSGATSGTVQSNTVTIKVDELLNVAVAGLTSSATASGSSPTVLAYSVTNTGNGAEQFNLTVTPSVTGNGFDAVVQSIVIDTNGNGTYDPGTDQVLAAGAATPTIASDASLTVFILVTLPSGATNTQTSQVRLTANAATGTGAPGTVITGAGAGGGDAVVGSSGASGNALDSLIASLGSMALVKSAVIADPFGGVKIVPGALVTYSLVATVSASGAVDNVHITDVIPAGTTYQAGSLKLAGSTLTDIADSDAGTASSSGIDVSLGTVPGSATKTVQFTVKIN